MFRPYQPRQIAFRGCRSVPQWTIKTYTISPREEFSSAWALSRVRAQIPNPNHGFSVLLGPAIITPP